MAQDSGIYEIASMMASGKTVKQDMDEIIQAMGNMIHDKYIGRIQSAVNQHHERISGNPTKEVQLLNAMKPFMNQELHGNIDQIIEGMNIMNTVQSLRSELNESKIKKSGIEDNIDNLYRDDGVYEIDEECMKGIGSSSVGAGSDWIIGIAVFLLLKDRFNFKF